MVKMKNYMTGAAYEKQTNSGNNIHSNNGNMCAWLCDIRGIGSDRAHRISSDFGSGIDNANKRARTRFCGDCADLCGDCADLHGDRANFYGDSTHLHGDQTHLFHNAHAHFFHNA